MTVAAVTPAVNTCSNYWTPLGNIGERTNVEYVTIDFSNGSEVISKRVQRKRRKQKQKGKEKRQPGSKQHGKRPPPAKKPSPEERASLREVCKLHREASRKGLKMVAVNAAGGGGVEAYQAKSLKFGSCISLHTQATKGESKHYLHTDITHASKGYTRGKLFSIESFSS